MPEHFFMSETTRKQLTTPTMTMQTIITVPNRQNQDPPKRAHFLEKCHFSLYITSPVWNSNTCGPLDILGVRFCDWCHETHTTAHTTIYHDSALSKRERNTIESISKKGLNETLDYSQFFILVDIYWGNYQIWKLRNRNHSWVWQLA